MSNNIEEKIKKVFSDTNNNKVDLNTEQANTFIDYIQDETAFLKKARVVKMNKPILEIAKINIGKDILVPGGRGTAITNTTNATPSGIELVAKKCVGKVTIYDEDLMNNIEGDAFKDHMMRMIALRIGNQLEPVSLYSRKLENPSSLMKQFDGFFKRIEQGGSIVDATTFADRYIDREKLSALYKSIPGQYRSFINSIFMNDSLKIDYQDKYIIGNNQVIDVNTYGGKAISTANLMSEERPVLVSSGASSTLSASPIAGATTITLTSATGFNALDEIVLAYGEDKEFTTTIVSISTNTLTIADALPYGFDHTKTEQNTVKKCTLDGTDVFMGYDKNLIWGIQKNITIESQRDASIQATHYFFTIFMDLQVENPEMCGILKNLKIK